MEELGRILEKRFQAWGESAFEMLPNIAVAVLVLLVFYLLGKVVYFLAKRLLFRFASEPAQELFGRLAQFTTLVLGLLAALHFLHLDKAVTSLLAGAGVVGLALGFAFQDLAANFISGLGLSFQRPFAIGDVIESHGVLGRVTHIRLRSTIMELFDGRVVLMPNKDIFQTKLINYSAAGIRRVDIECGISYEEDLDHVEKVVTEIIDDMNELDDRETDFLWTGFGDSSINFVARFWARSVAGFEYLDKKHQAIALIRQRFDQEGIEIPFPIRTIAIHKSAPEAPLRIQDVQSAE